MGFKLLIALLWLSIPLCCLLWLRQDMERFASDSASQRSKAASISAELSRHAAAAARELRRSRQLQTERELLEWRRNWQYLRRQADFALLPFDQQMLLYCPATGGLLLEQQEALSELLNSVESTARLLEQQLRAEELLREMSESQRIIKLYSRQYQLMPGGRGIYLNLQDELAKQETHYASQLRERNRLQQLGREQTSSAEQLERRIQSALTRSSTLLAEDSKQTYWADLQARWNRFDPREELSTLVTRLALGTTSATEQ